MTHLTDEQVREIPRLITWVLANSKPEETEYDTVLRGVLHGASDLALDLQASRAECKRLQEELGELKEKLGHRRWEKVGSVREAENVKRAESAERTKRSTATFGPANQTRRSDDRGRERDRKTRANFNHRSVDATDWRSHRNTRRGRW